MKIGDEDNLSPDDGMSLPSWRQILINYKINEPFPKDL